MKLLVTRTAQYLAADEVVDAVTHYALRLAQRREVDVVDIPYVESGHVRRARFTVGWLHDVTSTHEAASAQDLGDVATVLALYSKADRVSATRGEPFDDEYLQLISWPAGAE